MPVLEECSPSLRLAACGELVGSEGLSATAGCRQHSPGLSDRFRGRGWPVRELPAVAAEGWESGEWA